MSGGNVAQTTCNDLGSIALDIDTEHPDISRMLLDITNQRFDRLIAISPLKTHKGRRWLCMCECGGEKIVRTGHLRAGMVRSCGCLNTENSRLQAKSNFRYLPRRDGLAPCNHPLFRRYRSMINRCYNTKVPDYPAYGGRGITVSQEWLDDFWRFVDDVGLPPGPSLSIDRIDNSLGYFNGNVRWATAKEQARNRRMPKRA